MDHIEKNGLDSVGLYRLSGNAASVQKLRCIVEQGEGEGEGGGKGDRGENEGCERREGCEGREKVRGEG